VTERKLYFGTLGPYFYDDGDDVDDSDGDFVGAKRAGIVTHQIHVSTAPVIGEEVLRLEDVIGLDLADRAMAYYFGVM
jgi:hypothetical protein